MKWDWTQCKGHESQPLYEFYMEQLMMYLSYWVAKSAYRRGDMQTVLRMQTLVNIAAEHEQQP